MELKNVNIINNEIKELNNKTSNKKNKKSKKVKKLKLSDDLFKIPKYSEYENIMIYDLKIKQLKKICRYYSLKISGNKDQLNKRTYNFLRHSFFILKIQKIWKSYILKKLLSLKGPALIKRDICMNENDFYTMDTMKEIEFKQFISFIDKDDNVYGFDILSLYNHIITTKDAKNPYNRNELPINQKNIIKKIIRYSRYLNMKVEYRIKKQENLSPLKQLENRCTEIFQHINNLGNYSNSSWYWDLSLINTLRFIRELRDIWFYRSQLTNQTRRDICPPLGNPFHGLNMNLLLGVDLLSLKRIGIMIIENLVLHGTNNDNKILGANYVLCALTLVNRQAAEALPWLYQSVA